MALEEPVLKGLAALVSGAFAVLVLSSGLRKRGHAPLAAFLALISLNQAAETVRALVVDPVEAERWLRAATVAAALDPVALAVFVAAIVAPVRERTPRAVLLLLVPGALLALAAVPLAPVSFSLDARERVFAVLLDVYTAVVYVGLAVWVARAASGPAASPLAGAIGIAAIPAAGRASSVLIALGPEGWTAPPALYWIALALNVAGAALAVSVVVLAARGRVDRGPVLRSLLVAGLAIWSVTFVPHVASVTVGLDEHFVGLGRVGASVRWLAFGALASVAILRDRLLDVSLAARRRMARVVLALVMLAGAAGIAVLFVPGSGAGPFSLLELALIATVLVLSQAFRRLVDLLAEKVYGVPRRGDIASRLEAYRLAATQALADPRPRAREELERVRDELEVDAPSARVVEEAVEHASPLAVDRRVGGRYLVRALLGAGSQGRVFLARDEEAGRDVVLKEVPAELGARTAVEEARLAGGLAHPCLVTVHDAIVRPHSVILVSEFVPGGSLDERVASVGPLDARTGAAIVRDVLEGLAHAHARGVVHRDVKPSNVLLSPDGRARLGDFGIARLVREDATRVPGAVVGTPAFMAPEQARGERATTAADVFAVGRLAQRVIHPPLPPRLRAVIHRALEEDPAARWNDAGAMLAAWDQALAQ